MVLPSWGVLTLELLPSLIRDSWTGERSWYRLKNGWGIMRNLELWLLVVDVARGMYGEPRGALTSQLGRLAWMCRPQGDFLGSGYPPLQSRFQLQSGPHFNFLKKKSLAFQDHLFADFDKILSSWDTKFIAFVSETPVSSQEISSGDPKFWKPGLGT